MLKNKNISFKWIIYEFNNVDENQTLLIQEKIKKNESLIKKLNQFTFLNRLIFIIIFKKFQNIFYIKENLNFFKNKNIFDLNLFLISFDEEDKNLNEIILNKITFDKNNNFLINKFKSKTLNNWIKSIKESELLNECLNKILNKEKITNIKKNTDYNKKIIVIKNAFKLNLELNQILNLFTCFGNIFLIFVNYINGLIYIQFKKNNDINKIIKYKNSLIYNNKLIKVDYFYYSKIRKNPFEKYLIRMIKFNFNKNRYIKDLRIKFNPPNNKIIISNIDFKTKIFEIFKLVSTFDNPLKLKLIHNKTNNTNMCIALMESIESAIKIIMNLHNYSFNKLILRVSFSFSLI